MKGGLHAAVTHLREPEADGTAGARPGLTRPDLDIAPHRNAGGLSDAALRRLRGTKYNHR